MSLDLEQDWIDRKAVVQEDINALLDAGIPLETAKRLSGWNPTLGYATFNEMQTATGSSVVALGDSLRLLVSRSSDRVNADSLVGAQLDAATLYAVFIPDIPELNILDISFSLNSVPVHHEFAKPWDYAGTLGDGSATRVTFVAGAYEIEAIINASGGPFSISASFDVE